MKLKSKKETVAVTVVPEVVAPQPTETTLVIESGFEPLKGELVKFSAPEIVALLKKEPGTLSVEELKVADRVRIDAKKFKSRVEDRRKELKAGVLERGRSIDAMAGEISEVAIKVENAATALVKFEERKAAEAKQKLLSERTATLLPYLTAEESFAAMSGLGELTPEQFDLIVSAAKARWEERNRIARENNERLERERQAKEAENARLKAEVEAAQKAAAEAAKIRQQEMAAAEATRKAMEEAANKAKAEAAALRSAEEARKAAKLAADREAAEAARKAACAPDKEKLVAYIEGMAAVDCTPLATPEGQKALSEVQTLLELALNKALSIVEKL